ncbi:MAG: hypothetical protein JXJ30_09665, partial [Halothiobacillaceae bacterium]|nr:hypothetical protein [Halothiobacillaceae bacterium]
MESNKITRQARARRVLKTSLPAMAFTVSASLAAGAMMPLPAAAQTRGGNPCAPSARGGNPCAPSARG